MTGSNKFRCFLFDADNTLFDFDTSQSCALQDALLQVHGRYENHWQGVYSAISTQCWHQYEAGQISVDEVKTRRFQEFVAAANLNCSPIELNTAYMEHLSGSTHLIENSENIIAQLSAAGAKLVIITNGLSCIQRPRFSASPIIDIFDDVVISDEVGSVKPDAGIFSIALEKIGDPAKKDVLMIGDSLNSDIKGGNDFGIATAWFNPKGKENTTKVKPTFVIQCLEQLLDLVAT